MKPAIRVYLIRSLVVVVMLALVLGFGLAISATVERSLLAQAGQPDPFDTSAARATTYATDIVQEPGEPPDSND
jgi:hypothetical protein